MDGQLSVREMPTSYVDIANDRGPGHLEVVTFSPFVVFFPKLPTFTMLFSPNVH